MPRSRPVFEEKSLFITRRVAKRQFCRNKVPGVFPPRQSSLAGVLDRSGEEEQAVAMGEAALATIRKSQSPAPYVGQAERQLADILSDSDPKRALELARAAQQKYGEAAYWAKEQEQVERLIERLSGRRLARRR